MPPRAVWLALAAAALFGASTPLAKALVGEMPPVLLAGLLYLGSGLGLMTIFAGRRLRGDPTPGIDRPGRPWLAAAIVFGGIVAPIALVAGLRQTTGAAAALSTSRGFLLPAHVSVMRSAAASGFESSWPVSDATRPASGG